DSALIMSDLISSEFNYYVSKELLEIIKFKYAFVQFGNNKGPDNLNSFINNLKEFSNKNNLKIILCPIGLALDHSDDKLLKKIQKIEKDFLYYEPKNLYEIMFLIKESNIYIGTSLHGVITAQSFNKPFFVFPEKINKLKVYIETWFENAEKLFGEFDEFQKLQEHYFNFDYEKQKEDNKRQKQIIYEHYSKIFKI
ncbi:MAG: hypothetical protein CMC70_06260, partial [Flavobacteriaceae bacterium]|nr:hypothetical protein [Flavobacteriaceae bacterium]